MLEMHQSSGVLPSYFWISYIKKGIIEPSDKMMMKV